MKSKKFLEFNGKNIFFQSYEGEFYIALKPICTALGINYERQFMTMKNDPLFGQLYALKHMVGADNRSRPMASLSEVFIYGWIFSLRSKSPDLIKYQIDCCRILFNFFNGTITQRKEILKTQIEVESELELAKARLLESEEYKNFQEIKKKNSAVSKSLDKNDVDAKTELIELNQLFDAENNPAIAN